MPYWPEFFSGLIFTIALVVFIIAKITFIFISLSAIHICHFYVFTVIHLSLHGSLETNILTTSPLHRYRRGHTCMGSNPVQA